MDATGQRPVLRILPAFFLGCWLDVQYFSPVSLFFFCLLLLVVHAVLTLHPKGWLPYPKRWIPGFVIILTAFIAAVTLNKLHDERLNSDHISRSFSDELLVEVVSCKKKHQGGYRLEVETIGVRDSILWSRGSGALFVYLKETEPAYVPDAGSLLLVRGSVKPIKGESIPGHFDFRKWAALKQIHCQMTADTFSVFGKGDLNTSNLAEKCRRRITERLSYSGLEGQQLALVNALLTGDDDSIDPDLENAFSATGTLHILSVSGMHVAMVYAAIRFLLSGLPRRLRKSFVPWFSILLIWAYAFITGFSPAVQRASTTLTLFILSVPLRRPADSWNLVGASLLIILAIDPYLAHDSGLQLSYLAVAGILALSGWLTRLFMKDTCHCRFRILRFCKCDFLMLIGQSAAVSIAAQLFTSPLGLYEFHCFPVYFLPANLIVVPLSTLIIYGSILVVFFSFIGPVGSFVCLLLSRLTDLLIGMEFFIGELPGAVIGSLHISAIECILLYLALFCFVFFLLTGKSSMILSATTILFIQHGFRIMDNVSLAESSQVIQWKSKQVKACTVIQSGYGVTLVDPERTNDTVWLKKKLPTSLDALRIPEKNRVVIFKKPAESLNNR